MSRPARAIPIVVLSAALLAPLPPATAEPPTPVDPTPEVLAAGEACQFAISVTSTGKVGGIDLPNNPRFFAIAPSPGLKLTVTNLDEPANTVEVNATGAFRYVALAGGGTVIRASGHNLLYALPGIGATALATTGPVTITISADGEPTAIDVSRARVRDLCAELS